MLEKKVQSEIEVAMQTRVLFQTECAQAEHYKQGWQRQYEVAKAAEQKLSEWQQGIQAMEQCRQCLEAEIALTGDLRKTLETEVGMAKTLESTVELEEEAMSELPQEKVEPQPKNATQTQALWE